MYFWPALWMDSTGRLFVRVHNKNQVAARFAPEQQMWQPVRKLIGPLYIKDAVSFRDWPNNFQRA